MMALIFLTILGVIVLMGLVGALGENSKGGVIVSLILLFAVLAGFVSYFTHAF